MTDHYRELRRALFNVGEIPEKRVEQQPEHQPEHRAEQRVMVKPETKTEVVKASAPIDNRYVELYRLVKADPNPYGEDIAVVDGFNLIMKKGEVVSVIGHSGCGKSTVLTLSLIHI